MQKATIIDKLTAFADWFKDNDSWYTRRHLAFIMMCAESSVGAAFGWLRRNGFVITSVWVFEERRYIYNLKRGNSDTINSRARRTRKSLSLVRQKLRSKVGRLK
jgi:hypothetical protein